MKRLLTRVQGGWFPKLNELGTRACFGFGRGVGWIDLATLAVRWPVPYGFPGGWIDNDRIEVQIEPGKPVPPGTYAYNVATGQLLKLNDLIGTQHHAAGSYGLNQPTTGKTFWNGKELPNGGAYHGVQVNGPHLVTSRRVDAERDIWVLDHFYNGQLLRSVDPPGPQNAYRVSRNGYIGYGYFGAARVWAPPNTFDDISVCPPAPEGVPSAEGVPVIQEFNGQLWALTGCEVGENAFMALRPYGDDEVIIIPAAAVAPDFVILDDHTAIVVGNDTTGMLEIWKVSLDEPRAKIPVPAAPPEPIERIGRRLYVAFYNYVDPPADLPQNSNLRIDKGASANWLYVGTERRAIYTQGNPDGNLTSLEEHISRAQKSTDLPVIAYWPRSLQDDRLPRNVDVIGVELYWKVGESKKAFEAYARKILAKVGRCAIICQCYTSNVTNQPDLRALVPIFSRLAKDFSNIEYVLIFSGYGRDTGYEDHPEVHALWKEFFAGVPGVPAQPPKAPKPPDAKPEPPMPKRLSLVSDNGQYVCAELDGRIVANRDNLGPWETFEVEKGVGDRIALRSDHGKYVCAEEGGGRELVANRDAIGPWESFEMIQHPDGTFSLKTWNGHFVCAEEGGGREVVANRTAIGPWEKFRTSKPAGGGGGGTPSGPYAGDLSQSNRTLIAGGKVFRPAGVTAFSLAKMLSEGRVGEAEDYIGVHQEHGINMFRTSLAGHGFNALSPKNGQAIAPRLLEFLRDRGAYAKLTCITGSKELEKTFTDWRTHVQEIGEAAKQYGNAVVEIANEFPHPSQSARVHNAENLRSWGRDLRVPWSIGAPKGGSSLDTDEPPKNGPYPGAGGTMADSHLSRGRDYWDQIRRIREIFAIYEKHKVPAWDNERVGAGERYESGRRMNDPVFFLTAGVLDRCFDTPSIHHQDAGLECKIPGPVQTACLDAYVRGLTRVVPFEQSLQYLNSGHSGSPVKDFDDATRAYSFVVGKEGITVVLGQKPGKTRVEWASGWNPVDTLCHEQATGPKSDGRFLQVFQVRRA